MMPERTTQDKDELNLTGINVTLDLEVVDHLVAQESFIINNINKLGFFLNNITMPNACFSNLGILQNNDK